MSLCKCWEQDRAEVEICLIASFQDSNEASFRDHPYKSWCRVLGPLKASFKVGKLALNCSHGSHPSLCDAGLLLLRRLEGPLSACLFLTWYGQPIPWASLLSGLRILPDPLGQVARPVVHQDTPALEQVRAGIGHLNPVPDPMRHGRLDHLPGMICPWQSPWQSLDPVPRRRGNESEQETGSPNDRGMIDDFRLWGSRRWRRINAPLKKTWWRT